MQLHLAAASPFSVWTSISRIVCLLEVMWRKKTVQPPEAERHEVKLSKGFFKVFTCYFIIENQQSRKNVNYLWYFVCLFHLLFYKNRDPLEYQYLIKEAIKPLVTRDSWLSYRTNRFELVKLGSRSDPVSWMKEQLQVCRYWLLVNRSRDIDWQLS